MMQENKTQISNILLSMERDLKLFQWQINGIYIWELIRVKILLFLQEKGSGESFSYPDKHSFFRKKSILLTRLVKNAIFRNPFMDRSRTDVLIFESGRKYLFGEEYIDMYTFFIEQELKKFGETTTVYETNYLYDSLGEKRARHTDFIHLFSNIASRFIRAKISLEDRKKITALQESIRSETTLCIDLEDIITNAIKNFKVQRFLYGILLNFKQPKIIYIVNYVDYFPLLDQAKKRRIKTVELQHGLIIKEALTYHFPCCEDGSLHYFPTQFFIWENFPGYTGKLPISQENIIVNKHNHLVALKEKNSGVTREKNAVLVAAQPFLSSKIVEYILTNAIKMLDWNFYYKVHPMQFSSYQDDLEIQELIKLNNVRIITNEKSVYELLCKCKYVIGIYSTTLFEAPTFGCIPLVLLANDTYSSNILEGDYGIAISEDKYLSEYISHD